MIKEIKYKATVAKEHTGRTTRNLERFVQAVALLVVGGWAFYALGQIELHETIVWIIRVSIAIIGLRGSYEFFKFFDR